MPGDLTLMVLGDKKGATGVGKSTLTFKLQKMGYRFFFLKKRVFSTKNNGLAGVGKSTLTFKLQKMGYRFFFF